MAEGARVDGDLIICEREGVAYQADMSHRVAYDAAYLAKFDAYDAVIAADVNAGRCALLKRHLRPGATVLDYGAGNGGFVQAAAAAGFDVRGFEVIPETASALRATGLYADDPAQFDAVCLWDVLEHLDDPAAVLCKARRAACVFVSIPVFSDLREIRGSKHYRPGEHFVYWTVDGFVTWMGGHGFRLLEQSSHEIDAGRECIGAFAFLRERSPCRCGGEMYLDFFDPIRRPIEWFYRCSKCGATTESCATKEDAEAHSTAAAHA